MTRLNAGFFCKPKIHLMKTILVTTDFSANSKAGVRFAQQLSAQSGARLIFYHVIEILKPTSWNEKKYRAFASGKIKEATGKLSEFVTKTIQPSPLATPVMEFICEVGTNVPEMVSAKARKCGADLICLSTHGAGVFQRILGTNASELIAHSRLPVVVTPRKYKIKPVKKIFYACDFEDLSSEVKTVKALAQSLNAVVEAYHYDLNLNHPPFRLKLEKRMARHLAANFTFKLVKQDIDFSLNAQFLRDITRSKADMIIMFTHQKRGWLERLLTSSGAGEMVFHPRVPLLSMRKKG